MTVWPVNPVQSWQWTPLNDYMRVMFCEISCPDASARKHGHPRVYVAGYRIQLILHAADSMRRVVHVSVKGMLMLCLNEKKVPQNSG